MSDADDVLAVLGGTQCPKCRATTDGVELEQEERTCWRHDGIGGFHRVRVGYPVTKFYTTPCRCALSMRQFHALRTAHRQKAERVQATIAKARAKAKRAAGAR